MKQLKRIAKYVKDLLADCGVNINIEIKVPTGHQNKSGFHLGQGLESE